MATHQGFKCNHCYGDDIVGIRYNCKNCKQQRKQYNLCEKCHSLNVHTGGHKFTAIKKPTKSKAIKKEISRQKLNELRKHIIG